MTEEMENALRAMDRSRLAPRVQEEIAQLLVRRAQAKSAATPAPVAEGEPPPPSPAPLHSAQWLRMLPSEQCVGAAVPGTEDVTAALLEWQFEELTISGRSAGEIHFRLPRRQLPELVRARALEAVAVALPRTPGVDLSADQALTDPLYAFCHSKGLRSLIVTGVISSTAARALGRVLGLRSARPPGNPRTLRVHVEVERILVEYLAATDFPALRRGADSAAVPRALAACLCALSVTGPHDRFLDPFCGDGAVLAERALLGPMQQAFGCDTDASELAAAHRTWRVLAPISDNLPPAPEFATWQNGRLPLTDNSVDAIATILPADRLSKLQPAHLSELARVLRPARKAVFLVPADARLRELAPNTGLKLQKILDVGRPTLGQLVLAVRMP
jgi:SAM-dependent methyltransferase